MQIGRLLVATVEENSISDEVAACLVQSSHWSLILWGRDPFRALSKTCCPKFRQARKLKRWEALKLTMNERRFAKKSVSVFSAQAIEHANAKVVHEAEKPDVDAAAW